MTKTVQRGRVERFRTSPQQQFLAALLLATLSAVALFAIGAWRNHSWDYAYFMSNLLLGWLPLVFALWLVWTLRRKLWSSWEAVAASLLWLIFLPNSFYMVSDFIHIREVPRVDVLYDTVMFAAFIFLAFILGLISLYLVHAEFRKRFSGKESNAWLAMIILLCAFAIYLGRDLRWNSWDVLINPAGLLFDISDRFLHPGAYPEMYLITGTFFILISSIYAVAYKTVAVIRTTPAYKPHG